MNKKILKEILKTESVSFSYEEIQQILDEELEKSPDEMDTQLVDLCVDVLSKQEVPEKEVTKTHRKISSKKLLLIAAVICILAILAIPVSAELPAIESQGGIIKVLENYISVNLTGDSKYNISTELQNYGIPIDLLPARFFDNDCVVTDMQLVNDNSYRFDFKLTNLDSDGYILVSEVTQEAVMGYYADIYAEAEQLQQITVDGKEIFVYSSVDGQVNVIYATDNYSTSILFNNLTICEVIEIVQNI
ncbi:MAG: DUF4367 domain-containing protein [Clostridia bacterium]|nr:DUF4367 domain-containing protein [Clostridia bacterium]